VAGLLARTLGKTVILVTHQAKLAAHADRVVTLARGRIIPPGPGSASRPDDAATPHVVLTLQA
jgi:ABC-type lipoprotein export system ATPase subunit